jgi:hypothetical protein
MAYTRNTRTTCITLNESADQALQAIHKATGHARSAVIRMCLEREYQRRLESGEIQAA